MHYLSISNNVNMILSRAYFEGDELKKYSSVETVNDLKSKTSGKNHIINMDILVRS